MSGFEKRLKKMDENWVEAKNDKSFGLFPEGEFKFQLQNAEVAESQSDRLQVVLEHLCIDGDARGEVKRDYLQLETEWGRRFTQQWIEKMGREIPESMSGIEEVVAEIAEAAPIYMARVKHRDGFANLTIHRLLEAKTDGAPEVAKEGEDAGEPADDGKDEAEEIEVKDVVTCADDDGEKDEGTEYEVTEIDDDEATIKNDDGDEYTVSLSSLTAVSEDGDEGGKEDDGGKDAGPSKGELLSLCQALDIADEVDDDDSAEDLIKKLCAYKWDRAGLMEDEVELLAKIGAEIVDKPKPEKKKKKKAKAKKTAKKSKKSKKKKKK